MNGLVKFLLGAIVIAGFAAAGLFGTDYLLSSGDAAPAAQRERPAVRVDVVTPERRAIPDEITAVGTMMPIRMVDLIPSAGGRVVEVPVTSTARVAAGDLIVQIDDRAERGALDEAEATRAEAEKDFRRIEELAGSNTVADSRLEEARAAFRRAEGAVLRARSALDDRRLAAPFAGTLGIVDVEAGTFLDGNTPITRLVDLSVIKVEMALPERYFDRIRIDQAVEVRTPAFADETFVARITLRAPAVDLDTRSFIVRAEIDNSEGRLVGGMFADAKVVLGEYDGLAIPDAAIISEGLSSYVFKVSDGTAKRVDVIPGVRVGALTAVRGDLSADDRIVVSGWDNLTDGAALQIGGAAGEEAGK